MTKEQIQNLLNELLELEERNDIGNLTRRERAEFQQIIREAFEEKEINNISINIPQGLLKAVLTTDNENPGIVVELCPTNSSYVLDIALVECNEGNIRTVIWNDASKEDYTNCHYLENYDEYIELEEKQERE